MPSVRVWLAGDEHLAGAGELLDAFNREYDDVTPGPSRLAERLRSLVATEGLAVVLAAAEPAGPAVGVAVLRFRPALWTEGQEGYLAELYVAPEHRGHGIGRALMAEVLDLARARGADRIELGTSEDDHAARSLYESLGFTNRETGRPDEPGSTMYVYERDL